MPRLELNEKEEGGLVIFVFGLTKLVELVAGEKGYGDSEDDGECESGVLFPSEPGFPGL